MGSTAQVIDKAYGVSLTDRFGLCAPRFHLRRSHQRGALAVTQLTSDFATADPNEPFPYDEAHLVGFQLWDSPRHELWQDGHAVRSQPFQKGETAFYDMRRAPQAYMPHRYNSLQFYMPHAVLKDVAQTNGLRFSGELQWRYGIPRDDPTIRHLGHALLPALKRHEPPDGLFLDHVLYAAAIHVVGMYGGNAGLRRQRGGLANWQVQRAKELMRSRVASDIALKELADACGLSVTHFARAFRQSTATSPHRWLREQRVERAKALLAQPDTSLIDVAMECGYGDQSHFTRVFTQHAGISPGRWRRENARRN